MALAVSVVQLLPRPWKGTWLARLLRSGGRRVPIKRCREGGCGYDYGSDDSDCSVVVGGSLEADDSQGGFDRVPGVRHDFWCLVVSVDVRDGGKWM